MARSTTFSRSAGWRRDCAATRASSSRRSGGSSSSNTWLRGLMRSYEDFWATTRAALEFALESAGMAPTPALCDPLMAKYLDLDLYPEAREALGALSGYKLAILSNGSPKMLDALVHASGIAWQLSDVISVDRAKTYKPDPKCYELVVPALRIANHEVLFVS